MNSQFLEMFKNNEGLEILDKQALVESLHPHVVFDPVFSKDENEIQPADISTILQQHGPFWLTIDADRGNTRVQHAIVVTDITLTKESTNTLIRYYDVADNQLHEVKFLELIKWVKDSEVLQGDLDKAVVRLNVGRGEGAGKRIPSNKEVLIVKFHNVYFKYMNLGGWKFKLEHKGNGHVVDKGVILESELSASGSVRLRPSLLESDGLYTLSFLEKDNFFKEYSIGNIVNVPYLENNTRKPSILKEWLSGITTRNNSELIIGRANKFLFEISNGIVKPITEDAIVDGQKGANTLTFSYRPLRINSPNNSGKISEYKFIVIHSAGAITSAVNTFIQPGRTSTHYLIDRDGRLLMMVHPSQGAIHAGKADGQAVLDNSWKGDGKTINNKTIGIDMCTNDLKNVKYNFYTEEQYTTLIALLKMLVSKYSIDPSNIIAHGDLNPSRRYDPDYFFTWQRLEKEGLSFQQSSQVRVPVEKLYGGLFAQYPDLILKRNDNDNSKKYGGKIRKDFSGNKVIETIQKSLQSIGYHVDVNGVFDLTTARAVKAFKYHVLSEGHPKAVEHIRNVTTRFKLLGYSFHEGKIQEMKVRETGTGEIDDVTAEQINNYKVEINK
jgi:N-acetyl-anhydromuramyl-L-alanine amidase AmpD